MHLPFIKWFAGVYLVQHWMGNGQDDSNPDMLQRPMPLIMVKGMPNCSPEPYAEAFSWR